MKARISAILCVALGCLAASSALAESYPDRPVTMIVPFPAGSGPDVYARIINAKLEPILGKPIVVENRPGAGGTIGGRALTRAEADGYTIMFGSTSSVLIAPAVAKDTPYDPVKAFTPVIEVVRGPFILSVRSDLPIKNLQELIAYAKANPGKLNYGTAGVGSLHHISTELLKRAAGIEMTHIPFQGGAQNWTALQSGSIDVIFDSMPGPTSSIQAGKARPIAVTGNRHLPMLPDAPSLASTPTFEEQKVSGVDVTFWFGIVAPAGTPADIIKKLNVDFAKAIADPDVKKRFLQDGMEIVAGTPEQFGEVIAKGESQWTGVVTSLKLKQQ